EARHREHAGHSFSQVRFRAAEELQERETAIFPHYSLLEGHDRFSRLPRRGARHFQPLHRDSCGFPSPLELFRRIGVRDWFARLSARGSGDTSKRYVAGRESLTLPTMSLQVIDRRPAGVRRVFDLAIDSPHAFLAGTVAVHNCIGNSGPLPAAIAAAVNDNKLVAAAVLSGNRHFERRIKPQTLSTFPASPPLVVAYALAGTVDIDFNTEPLGKDSGGKPVYLRDLWPSQKQISDTVAAALEPAMFQKSYGNVFDGNPK